MNLWQSILDLNFSSRHENNAGAAVPDFSVFVQAYEEMSKVARNTLTCVPDGAYGSGIAEKLDIDIFLALHTESGNPVMIYIHAMNGCN